MKHGNSQWPPLVYASRKSIWIRWRDFALTAGMWLIFAAMMNKEFELFFGSYLEAFGVGSLLFSLGIADLGMKLNWAEFVANLAPYVAVIIVLLAGLSTFSIHTLAKRYRSLRATDPAPLSLASQARDAALEPPTGRGGTKTGLLTVGLDDTAVVGVRDLLALMNSQEETTLVDVRSLRIAKVKVTADGHYQIEAAETMPSFGLTSGSPEWGWGRLSDRE